MKWNQLLSTVRIRSTFGGTDSIRSPGDPRTEFERDYGRSVFSAPVRRLQDKAQVYPLEQHDAVRTRLTHSMEVSSVARGLARSLATWLHKERGELTAENIPAVESIAATCGMIHDLGNPPFGHAGETAIAEWFASTFEKSCPFGKETQYAKDFLKWDGNAQTIRLVGRLQVLSDDFGLNLTCGTMSAALKYTVPSHQVDNTKTYQEKKKPGYFASEEDLVQKIRDQVATGDARNPLTYIVEASDDIVYSAVDLEDGVKKRALRWSELESALTQRLGKDHPHLSKALELTIKKGGGSTPGLDRDEALVQAFRTYAINEFVGSVDQEFRKQYELIIEGKYHGELTADCSAAAMMKACKDIARDVVYKSKEVLSIELTGRRIIQDLLNIFWEAARTGGPDTDHKTFAGKAYLIMSSNYRTVFEARLKQVREKQTVIPEEYFRIQLACDYVAGMTDSFAASLHRKLTYA